MSQHLVEFKRLFKIVVVYMNPPGAISMLHVERRILGIHRRCRRHDELGDHCIND